MRKDISIIRESIGKIVSLLTNKSIKVTQRGSRAFVQYDSRSGAIKSMNIPYLPDDASEEFVAAVQGFLDHEVGHVLFTDSKIMPELRKASSKVKNLANVLEDVYIERKMTQAFDGSIGNLNSVRRFYLDRIAKPKIAEALAAGDANTAAGYAGLIQFRAWGGQKMAEQFLEDNPDIAKLNKKLAAQLGPELIDKIKKANSSKECLQLAREMEAKLAEEKPKMDSPKKEEDGSKSDTPGKGEKPETEPPAEPDADDQPESGGDDDQDEDKPEPEDEGTTTTEADDSDKEREESSKTDEEVDPEAGDLDGDEDGDREESDDDQDEAEEGESKSSESDDEDSESDEEDPEDGLSLKSEEQDDSGEDEDSRAEADEGDKDEDGAPETADAKMGTDEADDEDDDIDPFDKERDFDEDMSRALTEAAAKEIEESDYQIFSTDWDEIDVAPKAASEHSIEKMVDATQHMVASIQKSLERAIAAKARKTWNPGQRRGRIAPGSLFKTAVGDDRVFRQRYETQAKNTAITLLIDCSGSMGWGGKIETAGMAAFALSSTLERLKVQHEVIGFTTRTSREMTTAMRAESMGVRYAREEALYMPVFKGFNERLTTDAKSRMAHLTEHSCHSWLRENVDGECLRIAAQRLKSQRAERHLLIVLSDGSPACPGNHSSLCSHLMKTSKSLRADGGVEVVGIGIMDANVSRFYEKSMVLRDLAELPTTLIGELSRVLLAG